MKTCSISEAKGTLGKLADEALKGRPTVMTRGGRLVILQAYAPPDPEPFDELIQAGKDSPHHAVTASLLAEIWQKGRQLAKPRR
jgi:hypothetical protein